MGRFRFESGAQRDQDQRLRDAWLASEQLKSGCDWNHLPGTCGLCGASTGFALAEGADRSQANVRESLLCLACRHNARIRAGLCLLLDRLPQGTFLSDAALDENAGTSDTSLQLDRQPSGDPLPKVYLTEQVTPIFLWLQRHLHADLYGSEFQSDPAKLRELTRTFREAGGIGNVQFQDVTRLDFGDASLDAIITFDVLEHVPDYSAAIAEFARTLRPGGSCVATFPFTDGLETVVRARISEDGSVVHLLEPEYHGDPISGGVLCFYHFGWDVLDQFRAAGFRDVRMVMPWDHGQGYLYGLWTLLATR